MKLTELFSTRQFSLSFQVFPPKTSSAFESILLATEQIASLHPSFMSVTYGAGGGTSQYTLDIARTLSQRYHIELLPHLTCISSNADSVHHQLFQMKEYGFQNIMALRGDLSEGCSLSPSFRHAVDLIKYIKNFSPDFCIGAACYPQVHPDSCNQREDILHLKEKVDAGCDFLTTQMFFDNHLLYNFLYKIREAGITVPVLAGIMPITNSKQVDRAIHLSGSLIPQRFKSLVDRFGSDPEAMKQAGIAYATDQIIDLYANGITNVHVYSMNKPEVARAIQSNLSDILGKIL